MIKDYFEQDGEKFTIIDGRIYKVLTKSEFVDRAVRDMNKKKNKEILDSVVTTIDYKENKDMVKSTLKLKSTEYTGAYFNYSITENDNGHSLSIVSDEGKVLVIPSKYVLETIIAELNEIRGKI